MALPGGFPVDAQASQEPDYLAWMRGAQADEADVLAQAARQQSMYSRQMARAEPGFNAQLQQGQRQIGNQFQNNGLFRGGARMTAQAEQAADVGRRRLDFNAGIQDNMAGAQADAARGISALHRQAADQGLEARRRLAINNAQAGVY